MRVDFLRHSGWIGPEDFTEPINIIGCGAVGSTTATLLAKMGAHKFILWDEDRVEAHNLANQAFDIEHIGQLKTEALKTVLQRFNPAIECETQGFFYSKNHVLQGPVVIATDSMSSRYDIATAVTDNWDVPGVFETRLGFDYGECHSFDPTESSQVQAWTNTLQSDDEIDEGPCNLRICTTLVYLASSVTVQNVCNMYVENRTATWQPKARHCIHLGKQLATTLLQ